MDHQLLIQGLQHHMGMRAIWNPELASAYLHASAFDGCDLALALLQAMRERPTTSSEDPIRIPWAFTQLPKAVRPFFTPGSHPGESRIHFDAARQWNLDQMKHLDPVARFNLTAMQAGPNPMRHLWVHTPDFYASANFGVHSAGEEAPVFPPPASEDLLHAEEWLFAYHQNMGIDGMEQTALEQLAHAIELGSQRAQLYQIKFFPREPHADEANGVVADELQSLLEADYPPAWDVHCARLHARLQAEDASSSHADPDTLLQSVRQAVRYGYETHALRLLSALVTRHSETRVREEAFHLFEQAARLGMPSAAFSLGFCYRSGWGVQTDMAQAAHWFKKAELHGNASASFQLGWMEMEREAYTTAFQHFELAAEAGDELAQLQCALMTLEGVGTDPNRQLAFRWFEAAADRGNATANLFCGYYHDNAWIDGQARNLDQALYHYRQSLIALDTPGFDTFFRFLQDRWEQPDAIVEGMLMILDELLPWTPTRQLVNLGVACWQHPTWDAATRWDRAAHYFEGAAQRGDATARLMQCVFSIHGYPGIKPTQAVAELQSILSESAESMEPGYRTKTVAALSLAYLNGVGTSLDYPSFLDLMDRESLPEGLRNQLDGLARTSAAYRLYRNQPDYNDAYWRAQFRRRSQAENSPPEPVVQVAAAYPRYLEELGLDGKVLISLIIDTEGNMLAPMVVEASHSGFEEPAMRALRHWRFLPALRDGQPVRARIRVPIQFRAGSAP